MITSYDNTFELVVIEAHVGGNATSLDVRLVVDTGCAHTTLRPALAQMLGYGIDRRVRPSAVRTAIGVEYGYMVRVATLDALGHGFSDVPVHVYELATGDDIDGLLGLSFLNQLNYEIRAREGIIIAERADTGPVSGGS